MIQNGVSLETRFWKSYKRNSDLKHGLNEVTMIEIEKQAPCWPFAKGQAAQNEMCSNGTVRETETRSGENSYKCSSVKPCFKSLFQNRDSRYAKSYKRSPRLANVSPSLIQITQIHVYW